MSPITIVSRRVGVPGLVVLVHGLVLSGGGSVRTPERAPDVPIFVDWLPLPAQPLAVVQPPPRPQAESPVARRPVVMPAPARPASISPVPAAPAVTPSRPDTVAPAVATSFASGSVEARPAPTVPPELAAHCPGRGPPDYPLAARRRGETGRVRLSVDLDATGALVQVGIVDSSGVAALDAAALTAVRRWTCRPAIRDGIAVPTTATQTFNFILEGR